MRREKNSFDTAKMLKSSWVFLVVFGSTSVFPASGLTTVTIDVNLEKSMYSVDELFVSNSMPHMLSKWDQMRLNDRTIRELCKALSPSSLRVLANPLFHGFENASNKKKRSHKNSHDESSKNSDSKEKATHFKHSKGEKDFPDRIFVNDVYLLGNKFDHPRSNNKTSGHRASENGQSAGEKESSDDLSQENAKRKAYRRSTRKKLSDRKEADMTVAKWKTLYSFIQYVGWEIAMDFTNLERNADRTWNTKNVRAFLKYAAKNNIKILDFSIGNEPNLYPSKYNMSVTAKELVQDYKELRDMLQNISLYKDSVITGPETTRPFASYLYYIDFAKNGGCEVVSEYSFHQYYKNLARDKPTFKDLMNTTVMDYLEYQIKLGRQYAGSQGCYLPIRITETASVSGGFPEVADRFVSGFLWLDELGVAARSGITRVYRFNIWGVNYSLLNRQTFEPNPDYYLTLQYKRLVEGKVFNVTTDNKNVRAYANAAKQPMYPRGSVVIYLVNVLDEPVNLNIKQFPTSSVDTYFFTPGDDTTGVLSKSVKVSGILMKHANKLNVTFQPRYTKGGSIEMPAQSFGFIVISKKAESKMGGKKARNSARITNRHWSGFLSFVVVVLTCAVF